MKWFQERYERQVERTQESAFFIFTINAISGFSRDTYLEDLSYNSAHL